MVCNEILEHGCLDTAVVLHSRFDLLRKIKLFAYTEELA